MQEQTLTDALWPAGTVITLCNVPFDAGYRNIWADQTKEQMRDYIRGLGGETIMLTTKARVKPLEPLILPVPFDTATKYNYIYVRNEAVTLPYQIEPVRRDYYYFITSTNYMAGNSTQLTLQLDVFATFAGEYKVGQSFFERGHEQMRYCPTVEQFLKTPRGHDGLDVPEGLDHGADYVTVDVKPFSAQNNAYIVITASANLYEEPGTIANANLNTSLGGWYNNVPSGQSVYIIKGEDYESFAKKASEAPWVAQCISSIQVVDASMLGDLSISASGNLFGVIACYDASGDGYGFSSDDEVDPLSLQRIRDKRYTDLTKLYTFPYTAYELTDNCGQSVVYRPELMQLVAGRGYVFAKMGAYAPPNVRMVVWPLYYASGVGAVFPNVQVVDLKTGENEYVVYPTGDFTCNALVLASWPSFSLVTNQYANYLASSYFTRNYQYSAADWANTKAVEANQLSRAQTYAGLNAARAQQDLTNRTTATNAGIDLLTSAAGLGIGSLGGLVGIGAAAGSAVNALGGVAKLSTNINAANEGLAITQQQQRYVADSNYNYQAMANVGDYQQAISAINATVQDARLTPPASVGNAGGEGFMWAHGYYGYAFKVLRIRETYIKIIGDYFLRYGYAAHRWITGIDKLNVCSVFSYWKLSECNLVCTSIPENYKDAIRGVFESGVTVWADPAKIGTAALYENEVIR